MCKKTVPTIEERNYNWLHNHKADKGDELDLIVNVQLMPEWESRGFITRDVEAFREKMNEGVYRQEEEVTDDDLLLDGISEEFPGEECIIKGLRRPNDNTLRHLRDRRAKNRHMREMKTVGGYDSICRGENGKTHFDNSEEWEAAIVATKEKHEPYDPGYWRRVDRRRTRHNGRAECREIPELADNADAAEEEREFYQEKADGTVDIDFCLRHNWMYSDLDDGIYGAEYDDDDDDYDEDDDSEPEYMSREWCEMECIDYDEAESYEEYLEEENSRLTRKINTYKDFIGEFNLGKLYQTWLAKNGKGAM